jgi:hypothetical protein
LSRHSPSATAEAKADMKKCRNLFSQLHKKAIFYGLVDEGGWFSQMLASRKTTAEYTKLTKTLRSLCFLWLKISLCLGALVAEIQSIKNNNLCETNPIFKKVKCL